MLGHRRSLRHRVGRVNDRVREAAGARLKVAADDVDTSTVREPGRDEDRGMGAEGHRCVTCGGQVPAAMPACPVCEPGVVLSAEQHQPLAAGARRSSLPMGSGRPVPVGPALAVLRDTPTLLLPPLLAVGTVAAVGSYWLGRVDAGPLWVLEMFLLLLILAAMLVAGFAALTFARAVTVAGAVNLFAGVDRPVASAAGQVARRIVSVASWTFMHGMTSLAFAISVMIFSRSTLRMQPGYDGVKNSQYVWQVMFGEEAGLARAMDRSAGLVRARLVGSRRFTLVVGLVVGGAGVVWAGLSLQDGLHAGASVPWLLTVVVVAASVSVWASLADVIDTAAWRLATVGAAPAPFTTRQLGGELDLPPAGW